MSEYKKRAIPKKESDISSWYNSVVEQAGLAEHGPVKGTFVMRPHSYFIWEQIQKHLDERIKAAVFEDAAEARVENAYFPLFIPESFLKREKEHVRGFSPELAVVTHAGGEKLVEPVVVRPTSETIMYDFYSRWVQSYRNLPLLINQWNNVVRWEKRPYYFLRTTEFLWQEGHTAHATHEGARQVQRRAMETYRAFYKEVLGVYGIVGTKSASEKFAGADETLTMEILVPGGKVLQGATSHDLGQNFSKTFNVTFLDASGSRAHVWQTSWGLSTRSIGAVVLAHGDNQGLVLPLPLARVQIVIIPVFSGKMEGAEVLAYAKDVQCALIDSLDAPYNPRVYLDRDREHSLGWRINQWELQGVPLRVEIGAEEIASDSATFVWRHDGGRVSIKRAALDTMKTRWAGQVGELFVKHKQFTEEHTYDAHTYREFKHSMQSTRGFIRAFWCENPSCETKIKEETKASTRCLPIGAPSEIGNCVRCGEPAIHRWYFGQSY